MKKPHTIQLKELQDWIESEEVTFANSSRENKRLSCTMNGTLIVRVAGSIVWRGVQPFSAVEAYNAITDKYVEPTKNFAL